MEHELRILHLEDSPQDSAFVRRELRQAGMCFEFRCVDTREAFVEQLEQFQPDLVISDYQLPAFDGLTALALLRERFPELPFILVSGYIGEDRAAEALRSGATDFLLKTSLSARLVPSVQRAMREAEERAERQRVEQNRMALEVLLRDAIESISGGFLITDAEDRLVLFNQQVSGFFPDCTETLRPGAPYRDFLRERLQHGYYPQAHGREESWFAEAMARHREANHEVEIRLSDGRWLLVTERRMSNGGVAGVSLDISALKAAQKALTDSDEQLKRAQRIAHMGSDFRNLVTDEGGWSAETYRIFGVSRETFVPTTANFLSMVHPEDRASILATRELIAKGLAPPPHEYRIIRPDGTVRHIYRESEIIRDEFGTPIVMAGIIQDITDRRRTEEQLRQAQKMEAVGGLTGGLAHDFNNLLGIVIGNLDLLKEELATNPTARDLAGQALEASLRGAALTRQLLAFSRQQPLQSKIIGLNQIVATTTELLRRTLGETIEIRLKLAADLSPAVADPAQVESALINLAVNARDAMPSGGILVLETANVHLDARYAADNAEVTSGDFAMIAITDTGTGMAPDIVDRVFEPFFTTKGASKGTGLGLSMVYGFAKQSGGHVKVYSEIGHGTTIRLYLPSAGDATAMAAAAPETLQTATITGNILVVEDNPQLRKVVVRQLSSLGHGVREADSAAAALKILKADKAIDLLFTDIVMPGGLTGTDLALEARKLRPGIKILLTSGFTEAAAQNSGELELLSKPYRLRDLDQTIRRALGAA